MGRVSITFILSRATSVLTLGFCHGILAEVSIYPIRSPVLFLLLVKPLFTLGPLAFATT